MARNPSGIRILVLFLLTWQASLLLPCVCSGQSRNDVPSPGVLRTSQIDDALPIDSITGIYVDTSGRMPVADIAGVPYDTALTHRYKRGIPTEAVSLPLYCRFTLANDGDQERSFYFFPGYFFRNIALYRQSDSDGKIVQLPELMPPHGEIGCRMFSIAPHSQATFYFKGKLIKANTNWLSPTLLDPGFVSSYFEILRFNTVQLNVITFVFCGILLMMIIYSLTNYFQNLKGEYLFYALYGLCMTALFFIKALFYREDQPFFYFFEEYLDYMIQVSGYYFYILFTRHLVDTARHYPGLDRTFRVAGYLLLMLIAVYSAVYFSDGSYQVMNAIENSGKYFLMAVGVFYVIAGFAKRNKLMNYLLAGNLAVLSLAAISQFIIIFNIRFTYTKSFFNQALFYYELGVVLELVLFLAALAFKNKNELIAKVKIEQDLKLQQEKKEFETKLAIIQAQQEERSRISADMHDELGSGVTAIRLMSELAKKRLPEQPIPEIEKISTSAGELMDKMNTIIWSMNATNDSVSNLIAYIRAFATELFESSPIVCKVNVPEFVPDLEISGEKRRNVFLVVKEALNNAMKHSGSKRLELNIGLLDDLHIEIHDFGTGIQTEKMRQFSSGLTNMQRRMETIGGTLWIKNEQGTTVGLSCPL